MRDYEAWRKLFWKDVVTYDELLTNLDFSVEDLSADLDYNRE